MEERTLDGVRVLELGEMVSAPYCTRLMASLGASVIKVEPPSGDYARTLGPFPNHEPHPETSGLFLAMNLDKKAVTLDLTSAEGASIFRRLAADSDILVENGPPRRLDSLGLGYESLTGDNPGLIMVSISPFGQDGPYRDYHTHDLNRWHAGGWGYLWKERGADGVPGRMVRGRLRSGRCISGTCSVRGSMSTCRSRRPWPSYSTGPSPSTTERDEYTARKWRFRRPCPRASFRAATGMFS